MARAGKSSPHLDKGEQAQAEEHTAPQALVIHEVVREEGERELVRSSSSIAWSGLGAGLSMGFSFYGLALVRSLLPDEPWSRLIFSGGYTIGFVLTILGRQELFTESTLAAVLPLLVRRNRDTFLALLRFWVIVLTANLVGTTLFAMLVSMPDLFPHVTSDSMRQVASEVVHEAALPGFVKAILAGWLIALMTWLLPSAKTARLFVIIFVTYLVALGGFPHIVAGSVEAAYAVMQGAAGIGEYVRFLIPTLIGNSIGGIAFVALLNHAPLTEELGRGKNGGDDGDAKSAPSPSRSSASRAGPQRATKTRVSK